MTRAVLGEVVDELRDALARIGATDRDHVVGAGQTEPLDRVIQLGHLAEPAADDLDHSGRSEAATDEVGLLLGEDAQTPATWSNNVRAVGSRTYGSSWTTGLHHGGDDRSGGRDPLVRGAEHVAGEHDGVEQRPLASEPRTDLGQLRADHRRPGLGEQAGHGHRHVGLSHPLVEPGEQAVVVRHLGGQSVHDDPVELGRAAGVRVGPVAVALGAAGQHLDAVASRRQPLGVLAQQLLRTTGDVAAVRSWATRRRAHQADSHVDARPSAGTGSAPGDVLLHQRRSDDVLAGRRPGSSTSIPAGRRDPAPTTDDSGDRRGSAGPTAVPSRVSTRGTSRIGRSPPRCAGRRRLRPPCPDQDQARRTGRPTRGAH